MNIREVQILDHDRSTVEQKPISQLLKTARRELIRNNLTSHEGIDGVQRWRRFDHEEGTYPKAMRQFLDSVSVGTALLTRHPERTSEIVGALNGIVVQPSRLQELQSLFLTHRTGIASSSSLRPEVQKVFDRLSRLSSTEGPVNAVEVLTSSSVSFQVKVQWFETNLLPALRFLEQRDTADEQKQKEQQEEEKKEEEDEEQEQEEQGGGKKEGAEKKQPGDNDEKTTEGDGGQGEGSGKKKGEEVEEAQEQMEGDEKAEDGEGQSGESEEAEGKEQQRSPEGNGDGENAGEKEGDNEDTNEGESGALDDISDEELQRILQEAEKNLREGNGNAQEEKIRALAERIKGSIDDAKKLLAFAKEHELTERQVKKVFTFSKDAGCTLEEANNVQGRMQKARELKDAQGKKIRDRLIQEFKKIIQQNRVERSRYTAPIRMSEGTDLDDPVEAMLDISAGVSDPTGFAREEQRVELEQIYGGFDVIFIIDKSGSMKGKEPLADISKWEQQQTFVFLFIDALHAVTEEFKQERVKLLSPLDVRVALVSFQGENATIELPLGTLWSVKDQYITWSALQKNIGGGTPDHLGLLKAKQIIEEDRIAHQATKKRLQLVLVSADGGSDNPALVQTAKETVKTLGAVVKAAGIGKDAKEIETTYEEDGKNLNSFDDTPAWAAEHVLAEARKLFPTKVKR